MALKDDLSMEGELGQALKMTSTSNAWSTLDAVAMKVDSLIIAAHSFVLLLPTYFHILLKEESY